MSALISRERVSTGARTKVVLPALDETRPEADVKGGGNAIAPLKSSLTWFRWSFRKPMTANYA